MSHITKTATLRVAIIIIASVTMIIGTIFSPIVLQQQAYSLRHRTHPNAGEHTLGNDNSITVFTDQSNNVQAAVTPTPTLTLQNFGVLGISKVCFPSCPGVTFSITVTGNNPQPSSFTLGDGNTKDVILGPGGFTVTESFSRPRDAPLFHGDCDQSDRSPIGTATGIIRAGETKSCVITNVR